jgi:hypothetical protein
MFSKILTFAAAVNAAYLRGSSPGNSTTSPVQPSKALALYRDLSLKPTTCLAPAPWYSLATNTTAAAK